jgi:Zn-dependent M28 family amino/carboxypeptidase
MKVNKRFLRYGAVICIILFVVLGYSASQTVKTAPIGAQDISTLQKEVIAKLTGKVAIRDTVILKDRSAPENKTFARQYLFDTFNSLDLKAMRQTYRENGENIYAVLDATKPSDEYIILGAHFDSVRGCPGANDDATGVAMVIGAASSLKQVSPRSKNIIFVLFDEEERGMLGSRAFAQKMVDEKVNVISVHTIDQMGWDSDGDRAVELEVPYEGAVELYQQALINAGFTFTLLQTKETGSDHSAFRRLNFKAVGLTEEYRNGDTTPHIHKSTDVYDTVNFDYLLSSTKLTIEAMKILVK